VGGFAAASLAVATFSPATTLAAHASPTSGGGGRVCTAVSIPVVLNAVLPVQIHGSLCDPSTGPSATIQLLLHGGTYNSDYWDFSYDPQQFSYALAANRAGYSTLDIDRVGYGQSSQVPSALLTGLGQANTIHQIVQQLQEGRIDGVTFPRVMLVGHSLGSGLAVIEAATYHDVAGVVLTGFAHPISPTGTLNAFLNYLYPAALDPKFAGTGVDVGYDTTIPGTRDAFFLLRVRRVAASLGS
jgi:pimeloyl-ACP methyl ester carboxylesterase